MKILICDDDLGFCQRVQKMVQPFFAARHLPAECRICTSAWEMMALEGLELYQLAFLDVDLVTANGIELGRILKQKNPSIMLVYISAYLEFAPQGYTVSAFRYILKGDIRRALPACLEDLYAEMFKKQKVLLAEVNREMVRVPYDDIFSLESAGRRIQVLGRVPRQPLCIFYGKLSELPNALFESGFLRIGRSAVVNMRYVRRIIGYKVWMDNGVELSVSRTSYAQVRSIYLEWKGRFGDV